MGPWSVQDWHTLLIGVSVLNLLAWLLSARVLRRQWAADAAPVPDTRALRLALLALSAGYLLGCAYRSWWPVFDIPRIVLVDSWLSSVAVGRSVATVAELCFVAQCALLLHAAGRAGDSATVCNLARWLMPMALLAETCSWYSVLSTSNLGHLIEETLWGLGAAAWTAGLLLLWPGWRAQPGRVRAALALCIAVSAAYVVFMFAHDVPMYWARWVADEAAGRPYLGLTQGVADVAQRWTVSHQWHYWRDEVAWMTLYFSVAVWASIALVHLPLPAAPRRGRPALARVTAAGTGGAWRRARARP
jgi:hypothetical protein